MTANRGYSFARKTIARAAARFGPGQATLALTLLIWEVVVRTLAVRQSYFPSPSRVLLELWREAPLLRRHALITGIETMEGLVLAIILGFLLAVLTTRVPRARRLAGPTLSFLQKLPLIVFAPLVVIWFGFGISSAAALVFLVCFLPLVANLQAGLDSVPPETIAIVEIMGAGPARVFLKIRLPACLPYAANALKLSIPLALAAACVTEFVGSDEGLGYLLVYASAKVDTTLAFSALTVLIVMALVLVYLIRAVEKAGHARPADLQAGVDPGRGAGMK
jgi:NitT/TauT family transport system permease protein